MLLGEVRGPQVGPKGFTVPRIASCEPRVVQREPGVAPGWKTLFYSSFVRGRVLGLTPGSRVRPTGRADCGLKQKKSILEFIGWLLYPAILG